MYVLIATSRGQGDRPDDYHFAIDGELVTPLLPECSLPDGCGCRRGFDGLESDRATTTALVVERVGLERGHLLELLEVARERAGNVRGRVAPPAIDQLAEIERVVDLIPIGAIVRRDGGSYTAVADAAGAA